MNIKKFGIITEQENGRLLFQDFHIDCGSTGMDAQQAVLFAVIQRLMSEFESVCKSSKPEGANK